MSRKNMAPPPPPRQQPTHDNSLTSSSQGPSQIATNLRKGQAANVPLEPAANGVQPSTVANTYITTTGKPNIVHVDLTNDNPAPSIQRKSALDETDIHDEIHVLTAPAAKNRVRTVATLTTMGAKVSQLVQGYESKAQDASNGSLQQPLPANNSRGIPPLLYSSSSASYSRDGVHQFTINAPVNSVRGEPKSKKKKTITAPEKNESPNPHHKGGPRYFECERCTMGTPYYFYAHVMEELRCGNCNHICCGDCVIKSIGEKCEQAEWHGTDGYWQWRMEREKQLRGSLVA